jgi:D-3-phosphoglycerate dehydrogenase
VKIVVPDDFPSVMTGSAAEREIRTLGDVAVFTERGADREDELVRRVADADVVLSLRAYARFTDRVVAACPRLRLISIWGTGTDNVDLTACATRNIAVTNTPGINANAVAEHTLALMLAVMRRIPAMDAELHAGRWSRGLLMQLEGRTLGLAGLGAIGRRVAGLAAPFGVNILAWTWGPDEGRAAKAGARHVPIETLLRDSDIVSLHMRLSPETDGFLSRDRLSLMKPTAFLINTARGGLVDREALVEALRNGRLAGAALDVFHQEPIGTDDPILALPNVVMTPHVAGMSQEVIDAGLQRAVENISHFLRGAPRDLVVGANRA